MSPQSQQIESLRRELQQMRKESNIAHRELRREMQDGFHRIEERFEKRQEDQEQRIRKLEAWRNWIAGISAAAGGIAGHLTKFLGGGE